MDIEVDSDEYDGDRQNDTEQMNENTSINSRQVLKVKTGKSIKKKAENIPIFSRDTRIKDKVEVLSEFKILFKYFTDNRHKLEALGNTLGKRLIYNP